MLRRMLCAGAGLLLAGLQFGCLERKETIRVARDGAVSMHVELSGDPGDFEAGDPLPEKNSAWRADETTEKDANGKESRIRHADRHFAAGQELPDAYADERDERHETALHFPTTVTIDRRPDGVYYHLKRTYQARQNARYNIIRELESQLFEEVKSFGGKDPSELSVEDRTKIVEALRKAESAKQVEFVIAGTTAMEKHWPQHYGLLARSALLAQYEKTDAREIAELLGRPESEERDARINRFGERLLSQGREAVHDTLRKLDVPSREIDQFFAAVDKEEQRRAVTEDIEDERWEVRVELPGDLIASNATRIEDGVVIWEFPGKAMFDRDQVLMATSFVGRE
jgi:hypothetical protein